MNYATKAPNFTRENAAEMARRATRSRVARIAREKAERETATRASSPDSNDARCARVQKQIDLLLDDMEKAESVKARLIIGAAIERLWKLVQPTAGQLKPGRRPAPMMRQVEPLSPITDYIPPPAEPQRVVQEPVVHDSPAMTNAIAPTGVSATAPPPAPKPPPEPRPTAPAGPPPGLECLGPGWQNHIIH